MGQPERGPGDRGAPPHSRQCSSTFLTQDTTRKPVLGCSLPEGRPRAPGLHSVVQRHRQEDHCVLTVYPVEFCLPVTSKQDSRARHLTTPGRLQHTHEVMYMRSGSKRNHHVSCLDSRVRGSMYQLRALGQVTASSSRSSQPIQGASYNYAYLV